jgi:cell wall-associated NlpC family hydrolase
MTSDWTLLKADMAAYARKHKDEESCGLIAGGKFWPCKNTNPFPSQCFSISAEAFARVDEIGVDVVFHSHLGLDNQFSQEDIKACKQVNVPWLMYCMGANEWHYMDPTGKASYLERQWIYGIYDCYGLIRDYYRKEFSIELDDFERGKEREWESSDWRMFEKNFKEQGFVEIGDDELKRGDVFLMQVQCSFPNHVGVLHDLPSNTFYHHLTGRLSEAGIYGGYWRKHTNKILRHRRMMQ